MNKKQFSFSAKFKMQVVLESFKNETTLEELANKYDIPIKNIIDWKEELLSNAHCAFEKTPTLNDANSLEFNNQILEKKLQQVKLEKKELSRKLKSLDISIKKKLIDYNNILSITQQCKLLELNRPSLYYKPSDKKEQDLNIIEQIKDILQQSPVSLGYRKVHLELKEKGVKIGVNKVHKLMKQISNESN